MQDFIDNYLKELRQERSATQLTLGEFISELEKHPPETPIINIGEPHSYRGYYSDLAFEKREGVRSVGELLEELKNECLNHTFEGYKGGDFIMNEDAPLWIADYGSTGDKMIEITNGDILSISTQSDW